MNVATIHYHLKRGGVTSVIRNAVDSLQGKDVQCLAIASTEPEVALGCPSAIVDELAYAKASEAIPAEDLAKKLVTVAEEQFGGPVDIWHIHNHSLGKNPALAGAVNVLAKSYPILLQIHDFAEDGRPSNYAEISTYLNCNESLYPAGLNIHYAVLNGRDYRFLKSAGFHHERLHSLPNAVHVPKFEQASEIDLADNRPLVLYPTRAIRRKNVGEALLQSVCFPDYHFATTLHPKNPTALPIYENWREFASAQSLSFTFGIGESGLEFPSLIQHSHSIITTSITEGFGLAYLEPIIFEKPLWGRDLPMITEDFKNNGIDFSSLYTSIQIPLDKFHFESYRNTLKNLLQTRYHQYKIPKPDNALERIFEVIIKGDSIDFGLLTEPFQQEVIECTLKSSAFRDYLISCNDVAPDSLSHTDNSSQLESVYGLNAYGERLFGIYSELIRLGNCDVTSYRADKVLEQFLDPQVFNTLSS